LSKFAEFSPGDSEPRLGAADGLVIREATPADVQDLARIAAEREGEPVEPWLAAFEHIHADTAGGQSLLLVAVLQNAIAGYGKASYFAPPAGSPAHVAPAGYYLSGVIVAPAYRRRGVGLELTRARIDWIAARSPRAYYFANERNRVTIELHQKLGFVELTRHFFHPQVRFAGGAGILFVCDLVRSVHPAAKTRTA
jgi:ribosomal protein S18 acetylase RimI-like enzyme